MTETNRPFFGYFVANMQMRCAALSAHEEGIYHRLLRAYWHAGEALPDDDGRLRRLANISLPEWRKARSAIEPLFDVSADGWRVPWLEEELRRIEEISRQRAEAGRLGGLAKAGKSRANAKQLLSTQTQTQTQTEDQSEEGAAWAAAAGGV
jgi:uncharacterized protein YdaU (DUF1376 family)